MSFLGAPQVAGGRYAFNDVMCFQDESFAFASAFRLKSWCVGGDKVCEANPADSGGGIRVCMFDCLFTHRFLTEQRVSWNSRTVTGEFSGKYGTGELIRHYFLTYILPVMIQCGGGVIVLDNASTHRAYEKMFEKFNEQDLVDFMTDQGWAGPDFERKYWLECQNGGLNAKQRRAWVWRYMKDANVVLNELETFANQAGIRVKWLPPYHPWFNPQEFKWCRIKQRFADLPPSLGWVERLRQAYEVVTEKFERECVDRAIRKARTAHEQYVKLDRQEQRKAAHKEMLSDPDLSELEKLAFGTMYIGDSDASVDSGDEADEGGNDFLTVCPV